LAPLKVGMQFQRELYKFFPSTSCAVTPQEDCVGGVGWRKLIQFHSIDVNMGDLALIGGTNTGVSPPPLQWNNMVVWDDCHHHFHFNYFSNFSFYASDGQAPSSIRKRGFCMQSVTRAVNDIWSPLTQLYPLCTNQGITQGWADVYNAGLTCNWQDVTQSAVGLGTLESFANPENLLCEGTMVCDANGTIQNTSTSIQSCYLPTNVCGAIEKPTCWAGGGGSTDNLDTAPALHRGPGLTSVTDSVSPTGPSQQIGPLRDTEFSPVGSPTLGLACNPGSLVQLSCQANARQASLWQVVRVCSFSTVLGCGTGCRFLDALANVVIRPGAPTAVSFPCPGPLDTSIPNEPGGFYSLYSSLLVAEQAAQYGLPYGSTGVACTAS